MFGKGSGLTSSPYHGREWVQIYCVFKGQLEWMGLRTGNQGRGAEVA